MKATNPEQQEASQGVEDRTELSELRAAVIIAGAAKWGGVESLMQLDSSWRLVR